MKSSSKFASAYARLNAEQKKAVDTIDGPVMVIAGPGTGKTEVLTMRIANIIEKGRSGTTAGKPGNIAPEAILALTFTESGVASMRKRLTDLVGTPAYRVTISTFHGFANGIIRNYPDKFPEIIGAVSITDIDQVRIVRDVIDDATAAELDDLKPFGDRYYYLKSIMSAINELKRQGVTPAEFTAIVEKEKRAVAAIDDLYYPSGAHKGKMKGKYKEDAKHAARNGELALVYTKYQAALRAAKQYDYSDMIMEVMRALETDESLRFILQEQYRYFLVDEHQDTNDAQNRIIELVAGGGEGEAGGKAGAAANTRPNLFVVGDEKQAIFRFQGASIANFYHFKTLYKDVTLIPLVNNYRSTQAILNAAAAVAPREGGHQLVANAGHPETPAALAVLSSPDAEYFFIAERAKALIAGKNAVPPEEIAVLYRENRDAAPLARVLEKLAIPFAIESDQDTLGDEDIQKLLRILHAVQHFGKPAQLFEYLHIDFLGIPPLDVYKLFSLAGKKRVNAYDVLQSSSLLDEAGVSTAAKAQLQEQLAHLSNWKRAAENMGAVRAFETIVRDSGFLAAIMATPSASQKLAKLHTLFELLKSLVENRKNYTLKEFFAYLDLTVEQGVSLKSTDIARIPGRIRLMTAHKAKGQEFDYVFIMNAVDGKWGSRYKHEHIRLPPAIYRTLAEVDEKLDDGDGSHDDNDERNLFYVALTRARKEIIITQSSRDRSGRELVPSQFMQELPENLLAPMNVTKYETDFATHRDIEFAPAPFATPDIEDKTFLRTLFDEQGLSVTALDNYLECPWHYFYVNLIRVPEAPNKHLMFGNAVHDALKHYFDLRAEGDDRGKAYLVTKFEEALVHQPIEESDYEETLAKGRKSLAAWFDNYHKTWPIKTQNEVRIAGITIGAGDAAVTINGKLDKIEMLDASGKVNVVDYKTGKPQTRNAIEGKTKTGSGNYKRQLVFYRLLLDKGEKFAMVSGDIDFIEPDESGKFRKENFAIEPTELVELEATVIRVADEIRSLAFWNSTCDDPECEYCGLRKIK
jgi:DNA helicase-2/ATP-dependent DNA helicase PcrA